MTAATLRALPINLRNRFGKELLDEIEGTYYEEGDPEIDVAIVAAEAHVSARQVRGMASLN